MFKSPFLAYNQVRKDTRKGRYGFVRMMMTALIKLIGACQADLAMLDLYQQHVFNIVLLLLGLDDTTCKIAASETFIQALPDIFLSREQMLFNTAHVSLCRFVRSLRFSKTTLSTAVSLVSLSAP